VERVARANCKYDTDPLKYVETLIIDESQVLLARAYVRPVLRRSRV
jgi:hypothetical protein